MISPTPDAAVRTAAFADAGDIARVQHASWSVDLLPLLPADVAATVTSEALHEAWAASLSDPPTSRHRALVATVAGTVVGAAALAPVNDLPQEDPLRSETGNETDPSLLAELIMLAVQPDARRGGHGSRLLNAVVDTARANSFEVLQAWVPEADAATLDFLEAAGLSRDGARRARVVQDDTTVAEVRVSAAIVDR